MTRVERGAIIPNGVSLEKHESETIVFFTELGYTVELIPPSHRPNTRSADFKMLGLEWEMKSPKEKSRSTLEHAFQMAVKQSENIIFDLRRYPLPIDKTLSTLARLMQTSKKAKRLWVITKERSLLKYPFDIK